MASQIRTRTEVEKEVARLRTLKSTIPQKSMFGDNNWDLVEAQARVLHEGMDRDEIYETWPDEDELYLLFGALEAEDWVSGENDDAPSSGWDK